MRITLKQLRVFAALARFENMTQAAEDISLTQSAMSMALKELESQLDAPLFHRYGKRIKLNEKGQALLPKVLKLIQLAQEIEYDAGVEELAGQLRVGASSTIGNYVVPSFIADFLAHNAHVDIDLKVGNTQQIIQDVLYHRLDIGLIEGLCDEPQLDRQFWQEDELVIVAAANHPLSEKGFLDDEDIKSAQWILREQGSGTREIFAHAFQDKFQPTKRVLELGNTEAIKQAVKTGFGISCLSRLTIESELKHGELSVIKVQGINLHRQLTIIKNKSHMDSQLAVSFEKTL